MEIQLNEKNREIITDLLDGVSSIIQDLAKDFTSEESDIRRLTLIDLVFRQYPNLNSIRLLFEGIFKTANKGNTLPIGLIMRCSLEDMLFAKYLLSFEEDGLVFENEIIVQSRNAIRLYLNYVVENAPEFWMCSEEQKKEVKKSNEGIYNKFKKDNPVFFDENGKIKSCWKIRRMVPQSVKYFDSANKENQGPCSMFNRLKAVEKEFSYIYFEYKFYCLFEHYSFHTRSIMEMNDFTFGHLCLSSEFVLRSLIDILEYLRVDERYIHQLKIYKERLGGILVP